MVVLTGETSKGATMKKQHVWSVLAAGVLTLSACGGSDTTDAAVGDDVEYVSPVGEFLGWDQGADFDNEAAEAEFAQQEREAQEAIAACMAAEGFEYIPVDNSARQRSFEDQFDGLEWGSDEWVAKYGFGVSTQQFSQAQVGPDLVGHTWNDIGPDGEQPIDPNQAYVESLSENERMAYQAALWGGPEDYEEPIWEVEGREPTDEELDAYFESYVPTGCENVAYEEIYNGGEEQQQFEAFDEAFGDWWVELDERMESHPDVIAHRSEIRACVEERGVEYMSEEDAWEYFTAELEAVGLGWETFDPFAGVDTSEFTDEDYDRIYREFETQPLPADKLVALAEVQTTEINTAVAVNECGGGWQNEMAALGPIRAELEEEFLAANAEQLAEFEGVFGD